ncbi:metalloprotease [Aurantibacter sp.]|uniref:metalloprotease n=1 Tax=Aurantibacter sp. TaxID=2807103 RepID=UPI0032662644
MKKAVKFQLFLCVATFSLGFNSVFSQHINQITAKLNGETKTINIQQEFTYKNNSNDVLEILYFNDWAHAYSDKDTGLANRFAEEFKRSLHLAKKRERGYTEMVTVVDDQYRGIRLDRTSEKDILKMYLNEPLPPGASVNVFITYNVILPQNKFTPYGYDSKGGYYLKDWYLTPAVYDGKWHLYSNKNLEDLYTDVTETTINLICPKGLFIESNYQVLGSTQFPSGQQVQLQSENQKSGELILSPEKRFTTHVNSFMTVTTDLEAKRYDELSQGLSIEKVSKFIVDNLGEYPHKDLLVSQLEYNKNPLYGINQLPSFIRPYGEQFQYEMKFLKTALNVILNESLYLNPRKEKWLSGAIANYLMIKYVEEFYPDQKLLGKLSKIWGVRSFHLAQMDFNEQYPLLYMLMARKNIDQPLTTPNDSLLKFNQKIANNYKAGLGLAYLANYIGEEKVDEGIKTFFKYYKLNEVKIIDFESIMKRSANTNIDWFFRDYVSTDEQIDFKIKKVIKSEDSLKITLRNKTGTNVPISLFGLKKDTVISKYWFSNIADDSTVTIARSKAERLVLNYDQKIPEFNQRDNWKSLKGFLSSNKKLKFQFFKDAEDPYYNQIFYVPVLGFNIYDGWSPGLRIYNKTLLERPFVYDFSPSYAMKDNSFVGSGKISYKQYHGKSGHYVTSYSLGGSTSHFQVNSRYSIITPSITFGWRPKNLRSNKRMALNLRYVNVFRTIDESLNDLDTNPDYSVLNARFFNSNNGIIDYSSWLIDAQQSNIFTKLSFEWEYRKLFQSNRQLNLRFFAGKFLRNKIDPGVGFFNFALDRPTDYLFDYSYLGRSENSGIYSQQIIIAEGGFKSFLDQRYRLSNDWIATANASVNLWRWIEVYGDLGFVKNKNQKEKFVYDSGIRLNLLTDYFELYLPVYSNNGWEISQPSYGEKIRFVVTLSPKTLIGLFTRKWF